jgi:hypothetical protein
MKIVLDTQDVKDAIRTYVESTGFVDPHTPITMDIIKLRKGDGLTVEITINSIEENDRNETMNEEVIQEETSEEETEDSEETSNPFTD